MRRGILFYPDNFIPTNNLVAWRNLMKFRRLGIIAILLSILVTVFTGCKQEFSPGTYIDDTGREVSIDKVPQRIVSHVPSITETLFALGLGDRVVGVSDYCDYPEEAKLKPSVGAYYNPNIETIVAQAPDLVLTDGEGLTEDIIPQLENLGITCVVINPKSIDGILKDIELLGKITGMEKEARVLVSEMSSRFAQVASQAQVAPKVRVFYVFDATDLNNPWTAGPGSFVDALITMAGGENIAAQAQGAWVQLSIEQLVSSDPEVILIDASMGTAVVSEEELMAHPAWQGITAVKQDRIYTIDGDLVNRSGPRIIQGLEEIAKAIHPELFAT
jgi:iron complex transport system substrate-binding protein